MGNNAEAIRLAEIKCAGEYVNTAKMLEGLDRIVSMLEKIREDVLEGRRYKAHVTSFIDVQPRYDDGSREVSKFVVTGPTVTEITLVQEQLEE